MKFLKRGNILINKLLSYFKSSETNRKLKQERDILLDIIEQKQNIITNLQGEVFLFLGSILTAYNGELFIDKKFIDIYLNNKMKPNIKVEDDGSMTFWLEEEQENNE